MSIPGKGMRRYTIAEDSLHLLGDKERIVIQVRTPHLTTSEDAIGPACKMGIALTKAEAVKTLKALLDLTANLD